MLVLPDRAVVKKALAPHQPWITVSILNSWQDWLTFPHAPSWRCKRSRANFLWEQIIDKALNAIVGLPSVRYDRVNESFTFIVNSLVVFRFKKAAEDGVSTNYPTQAALAFHDHQQPLTGVPVVHRVEVVYVLDLLESNIQDIRVVARNGNRVHWHYSLLPAATSKLPPKTRAPTSPTQPLVVLRTSKSTSSKQPKKP